MTGNPIDQLDAYGLTSAALPWWWKLLGDGAATLSRYSCLLRGLGIAGLVLWYLVLGLRRCWPSYTDCLITAQVKAGQMLAGKGGKRRGGNFCPNGFKGADDDEIHENLRKCARRIVNNLSIPCHKEMALCMLTAGLKPFRQPQFWQVRKDVCDDLCRGPGGLAQCEPQEDVDDSPPEECNIDAIASREANPCGCTG